MLLHLRHLKAVLSYVYSSQARFLGKYDERDLLLGHGIDNLTSIRVVIACALCAALMLMISFYSTANSIHALLFILVMEGLCLYALHLPRAGMAQAMHSNLRRLSFKRSYRSYLQGRILFTPYGISLSFKKRTAQSIRQERYNQAQHIIANASNHLTSSAPNNSSSLAIQSTPENQLSPQDNSTLTLHDQTSSQGLALEHLTQNSNPNSDTPLLSTDSTFQSKMVKVIPSWGRFCSKLAAINRALNKGRNSELSYAQVSNAVSKAQQEHNARLYLANHGHKSAAMILQSGVSVDDYVMAQGILAATNDEHDLPVANSGYISQITVPLLCDQRIYAGKPITMEAIAQILCAKAAQESKAQRHSFMPTDLCLLGFGFEWLPKHSRALRQIMAVGTKAAPLGGDGSPDIHAVEVDHAYEPIVTSTNKLKGHTLLLGTTGSGKTRFFDLLVSQAIMRGDTVIVLDPKGDRDLQRSIIKAARAAEREPYQNLICLDIGRPVSNPLTSENAISYAAASTGVFKQFAMDSRMENSQTPIAPLSPFELSRNSLTTSGHLSLINEDFYERMGANEQGQVTATAINSSLSSDHNQERMSFNYEHQHYIKGHNATQASLRAQKMRYADPNLFSVTDDDPDEILFDEINFGLNPTSVFDRASEVASRLTSMVGGAGSSANFKAYAAMAITAAVECCRLLGEKVTLDAIRGYVANHHKFALALRDIINQTVVNLNNVYCSRYYNRLYGISDEQLVRNAYTVSVLMANGYKYISLKERAKVLAILEDSGLLELSDKLVEDADKLNQIESLLENQSLTQEIRQSTSSSSKSKSKKSTTSDTSEKKPRYLAAPAPMKALYDYYLWLTKSGYLDRDNAIEQIFEVSFMDPVFFQKVTNSIMPSLVSLTSGVLKQLLSSDDCKQTSFMEIVRNNKIFYSALHCLKDSITGQNLGKLLMADLAYVAGEINAKNIQGHHQVTVFIDEASELANEVLVQLLNKSRASNFAVTIATQSVADLRARVNSKDAADQLIANCNNLISLRVEDEDTANVIAKVLPNTVCTQISTSLSVTPEGLTGSSSASRTLSQQDCEYFPATMLMQLPNFEFIARLANGSCYKGFIPIVDKLNSKYQHPSFDTVDQAQDYAYEQNSRMRQLSHRAIASTPSNRNLDLNYDPSNKNTASVCPCPNEGAMMPPNSNHTLRADNSPMERLRSYAQARRNQEQAAQQSSTPDHNYDLPARNSLDNTTLVPPPSMPACQTLSSNKTPANLELNTAADKTPNPAPPANSHLPPLAANLPSSNAQLLGISSQGDNENVTNTSLEGPHVNNLGFTTGYSHQNLEQENKVYVGNEQNLLYSHFNDQDYQSFNQDHSSCNAKAIPLPKNHNQAPAPIMISALEHSQAKMNREFAATAQNKVPHLSSSYYDVIQNYQLLALLVIMVRSVCSLVTLVSKGLLSVLLHQGFLQLLAIAKELSLLLLGVLLILSVCEPQRLVNLKDSANDLLLMLTSYGQIIAYGLGQNFDQINELLYQDSTFFSRLGQWWQVFSVNYQIPIALFALSLLWGNHYGLLSEMHHRSLLALRTLLRPGSLFNLALTISAVLMLYWGIFPCVEYALLISWFKIALIGFSLTCFYSMHTK